MTIYEVSAIIAAIVIALQLVLFPVMCIRDVFKKRKIKWGYNSVCLFIMVAEFASIGA